jgi:sulfite reductase alpha subunit-like flavoprotein
MPASVGGDDRAATKARGASVRVHAHTQTQAKPQTPVATYAARVAANTRITSERHFQVCKYIYIYMCVCVHVSCSHAPAGTFLDHNLSHEARGCSPSPTHPTPQDVRRILFELPEGAAWYPGDVATLCPRTLPSVVSATADYLRCDLDAWVTIRPSDAETTIMPASWAGPMQVRRILEEIVCPSAPPRRATLALLARFVTAQHEKEKLLEFNTAAGQVCVRACVRACVRVYIYIYMCLCLCSSWHCDLCFVLFVCGSLRCIFRIF